MKGGKRSLSAWNLFVKKIFKEGKTTNSNYQFKDALKDASRRKKEMGSSGSKETRKMKSSKKIRSRRSKSHKKH
jgi:hypothetical protein